MTDDVLELAADDLAKTRARIDESREALRRAIELGGGEEIRRELERLDRIAGELERVEAVAVGHVAAGSATR